MILLNGVPITSKNILIIKMDIKNKLKKKLSVN